MSKKENKAQAVELDEDSLNNVSGGKISLYNKGTMDDPRIASGFTEPNPYIRTNGKKK